MTNNLCNKFGTPYSPDLQQLQNLCVDISAASSYTHNLLVFLGFNLIIFFLLIFVTKIITNNEIFIRAYYKSSFSYFIQTTTIIGLIPLINYFLENQFSVVDKIIVTGSIFILIFLKYEYWPIIKKNPPVHHGIYPSIMIALFTLSYYELLQTNFSQPYFATVSLLCILFLYCMLLHIILRFVSEVRRMQRR